MKKLLLIIPAFLFGLLVAGSPILSAHAEDEAPKAADAKGGEEAAEAPKEGDKDAAKPKEGGEGGGKKKGSGDVSGGRFAGDPIYVKIQPIVLPIILQSGVEQLVTIQIAVEVKDFDAGDDMHTNMPRVLDALNRALYGSLEDGSSRNGRMVDVEKLKAKATTALQGVMGADNIKDVLIMNLSQRML